jgi:hypothetical protein
MSFAFVFPGQGSQSVGMMAAYGDAAVVRATFDEASSALGDDLWAMVADGPAEVLTQTVNTQPVMLTAGIAAWRLWQEMGGRNAQYFGWAQSWRIFRAGRGRRYRFQGCRAAGAPACGSHAGSRAGRVRAPWQPYLA